MSNFRITYTNDYAEYIFDVKNSKFIDTAYFSDYTESEFFLSNTFVKHYISEISKSERVLRNTLISQAIHIEGVLLIERCDKDGLGEYDYTPINRRYISKEKEMTNLEKDIENIVRLLENGSECQYCNESNREDCDHCHGTGQQSALDYINNALEVIHMKSGDSYAGSKLIISVGGPNISIDFSINAVIGRCWGEKAIRFFESTENVNDIEAVLEEMFGW